MPDQTIELIEPDEKIAHLMKSILSNRGYQVTVTRGGKQGLEGFLSHRFSVIYLDMVVRDVSPIHVIREIKRKDPDAIIIIVVNPQSVQIVQEALSSGAFDYVAKPPRIEDIYFKTQRAILYRRSLLNNRRALKGMEERNLAFQKQNIMLAKRIEESTRNLTHLYENLRETYMRTIKALAQAIDARDHYTHSHSENVARYAEMIAREMTFDSQKVSEIRDACQLHDLGKIGVHDYILLKPGKLTPEEFEEVKLHAAKGAQILEPLKFLEGVIKIVGQHHERYDGTGYPLGLRGLEIDIGARIMAIADTYDSMVSARPYRPNPLSKEETVEEIKRGSGTQFDPNVVDVFLRIVDKF